jgi:hypothetical protein
MEYSKNLNVTKTIFDFLKGESLNEAYHEKDRGVTRDITKMQRHHQEMMNRHRAVMQAETKDKDLNKHDIASMAHMFALRHYSNLKTYAGGMEGESPIPDYHTDKEFYDKMGSMVTKRANDKSKECGVSCDTENK